MTKNEQSAVRNDQPEIDLRKPEPIDPDHRESVEAGRADRRAGRIATAAQVDEAFARFGRSAG